MGAGSIVISSRDLIRNEFSRFAEIAFHSYIASESSAHEHPAHAIVGTFDRRFTSLANGSVQPRCPVPQVTGQATVRPAGWKTVRCVCLPALAVK